VLAQSHQDYEVILIDDGSVDGSWVLCDQYSRRDDRIRVIHQKNAGVSAARNAGIRLAEGTYITFMDSDDQMMPSHLEQYYNATKQYDCDVVVGGFTMIAQDHVSVCLPKQTGCFGSEIWEEICRDLSIYGYVWNKLFRAELVYTNNLELCENMYSQEDLDFCLSVFGKAETVALIACDSYQYDYAPGKRTPPYWDYISNHMKMLRIGKARTELSAEAQTCVHKRILSLLYTGIYYGVENGSFQETVEKIAQLDGLAQLLRTVPARGEHGFVARNFASGNYDRIQRYFKIRNRIRNVVWAIQRRKR
jgi:glycosyltransferase involved in cell wall biosynthesis